MVAAFFAGVFPLDVLGELISIGILLAFSAVCAGVLVLRYTQPDTPRPFRVPFATFTGVAGVIVCFAMAYALPHDTWIRLAIWTGIGFAIYFFYGYALAAAAAGLTRARRRPGRDRRTSASASWRGQRRPRARRRRPLQGRLRASSGYAVPFRRAENEPGATRQSATGFPERVSAFPSSGTGIGA